MEEQILKIIKENHRVSVVTTDYGKTSHVEEAFNFENSAKEITSHIMEFIKWIGNRGCIYWDYQNRGWFLLGEDGGNHMITPDIEIGTTEELYQYWLNNVKNKNIN